MKSTFLLFLLSLVSVSTLIEAGFWTTDVEVEIKNGLEGGPDLTFHCKSKNDDLGVRVLKTNQSWSFKVSKNIFGTTLFFCGFRWEGSELNWFDILEDHRDGACNDDSCHWSITRNGPCRFNAETTKYDKCEHWNKN